MPTIALPTAPVALLPDDIIDGRYRIVQQLADGGMGTVFLAEHVLIRRRFAIKVLHRELAADTEMVKRFMNEALAAGTLGHPNIVEATDMGFTLDGLPFIVFEYLEGSLLTEEIYRVGGLPVRRAVRIARQIASAMASAHNANIVHLDLKADNVFLTDRDGSTDHVKVLDFGIARFLEVDLATTQRCLIAGTPDYMAPEQVTQPDTVDRRADIYALGVMLYEMLTARRPFGDDDDPRVLLHRIVHEQPRPLERALPIELERMICKRMLVKDRERRFQSMEEVEDALDGVIAATPRRATSSNAAHGITRPIAGLPPIPRRPAAVGSVPPPVMPAATPAPMTRAAALVPPAVSPAGSASTLTSDDLDEIVIEALDGPGRGDPTVRDPALEEWVRAEAAAARRATAEPPGRLRRALGWLTAAAIAAAAGGVLLATRPPATAPDGARARAALVTEAEHLAKALDAQARAARTRARSLAMAPMLRAAIETDAATLRDLAADEQLFAIGAGETLAVYLARGRGLVEAVRVPASAPPLIAPRPAADARDSARLVTTDDGLAVAVTVPVTGQDGTVGGALALASPVDLGGAGGPLRRHALAAALVGLGRPIVLVGDADDAAGATPEQRLSIPVPIEHAQTAGPLALDVTLAAATPTRPDADLAYGCLAVAGLLLLMGLVRVVDPQSKLDA